MSDSAIRQEDLVAARPNPWKPWIVASVASIAILGIAIGLMALLGLFKTPQDDTGTKSLAAALGLVGAVLSAVLTLVGTIIKYSLDERNYALALQAEHRNRIEAAIRAVDLLSENNQDATKAQMGGALLALVSLGELNLAVSLLTQLWPSGKVTAAVADVILPAALKSKSPETQIAAAAVLAQNASRIEQPLANIWPLANLGWWTDLNGNCRLGLVLAAAQWLISVATDQPPSLRDPAVVLYQALEDPDTKNIVDIAAACLRPVVNALPDDSWTDNGTGLRVTVADITKRLRLKNPSGASFTSYAANYEKQLNEIYAPAIAAKAAASYATP